MSELHNHQKNLLDPPLSFRPELRWWLAEGLHTDETLRAEIRSAYELGFGGMEFLAMDEAEIDHARYGWGSEEWVHDSGVIVAETTARKMAVSFTSGTNWANANLPSITPDHPAASQELNYVFEDVGRGAPRSGPIPSIDLNAAAKHESMMARHVAPSQQRLVAVVAAPLLDTSDLGGQLAASSAIDLSASVVGGGLTWAPSDERVWRVFYFWSHGTGQTASPSASINFAVNYLERAGVDAVIEYWDSKVLTADIRAQIARNPRVQMYMDSLELTTWGRGGLLWGRSTAEEFRRRRGYELTTWLPFLVRTVPFMAVETTYHYDADAPEWRARVEKVRHDYVQTLTDLYIEHMLRPLAQFLRDNGIGLRAEISYGLPFELTRPGPEVDGIETESFEFGAQIDAYRLLGGPAHLFGKQYSSETGATTRTHMLPHSFYDQIIATQLAAGITRTVLHGWASMAGEETTTQWPGHEGMWAMVSERFDLRQPGSEFYPLWNRAVGRFQYLLRQGRPRVDVGILRTDHFTDNTVGFNYFDVDGTRIPDEVSYATRGMRDRENYWWRDLGMQDRGLSYEFLDATLLCNDAVRFADAQVQPDGPGYQALIVFQETLDPDAAIQLLAWARAGLRVLIVNGASELRHLDRGVYAFHAAAASRTPGLDGRDAELVHTMQQMRGLPTVKEIADPAETFHALKELGVRGRAEFLSPNSNVLTCLREEGDLLHLYAYHFLYENGEPTTVDIALDGSGTIHRVDGWTGKLREHRGVREQAGMTILTLELSPGETALFILDRSAPAARTFPEVCVSEQYIEHWGISVESWDEGDSELIIEDRGLGYITREMRPRTSKRILTTDQTHLAAWLDLPGIGHEVSGIGQYRSTFELSSWQAGDRHVLDLGSTCGGLGSVVINDAEPRGFDTSRPVVDVTDLVRIGENSIVVRVSSSLNNRLLVRGYYEAVPDMARLHEATFASHHVVPRPAGLLGPVTIRRLQ